LIKSEVCLSRSRLVTKLVCRSSALDEITLLNHYHCLLSFPRKPESRGLMKTSYIHILAINETVLFICTWVPSGGPTRRPNGHLSETAGLPYAPTISPYAVWDTVDRRYLMISTASIRRPSKEVTGFDTPKRLKINAGDSGYQHPRLTNIKIAEER